MKLPMIMALAATVLLIGHPAGAAPSTRPPHASFQSQDDGSARTRIAPLSVEQRSDDGGAAFAHRDEQSTSDRRR